MSAKEKVLRRLLMDAEFYLNNIDNDDPVDLVGDATKAGKRKHPVDVAMRTKQGAGEESKHEQHKDEENVFQFHTFLLISYRMQQVLEKPSFSN